MTREEFDATADALATRARKGDADAFDDLCRLLQDDVWRYCYALLRDREQAFDASQYTFLRCVRAIPKWRGDAPVRVFLLVLARRAVADLIRREQRRRRIADVAVEPVVAVPQHTGTIEVAELINQLAEDQRQAFVLTFNEAVQASPSAGGTDFHDGSFPIQDYHIQLQGALAGAGLIGLEDRNAFYDRLNDPANLDLAAAIIATYGAYLDPEQTQDAYATTEALYLSGRIAEMMAWETALFDHRYPDGQGADWLARTDAYLLAERNETFLAAALPELEKGSLFIAIGAFHLPRDTGMIALLRREGYTVTRIPLSGEAP